MGIDQSLNSTGYYIIDTRDPEIEDVKGLIKPGNRRGGKRLAYIYEALGRLLKGYEGCKVLVCMEGYAYEYREGKVFELGEVGGIVKLCCEQLGMSVLSIPPPDLKKYVTGSGRASKDQMMDSTDEEQNDIADAHGLAWVAQGIANKQYLTERKKLEVIRNALKSGRDEKKKKKYKRPSKTAGVRL